MRYLLIILLLCRPVCLLAQKNTQQPIEVRVKKLAKLKEDTNKVNALIDLSGSYVSVNADEGIRYGTEGMSLAEKLGWEKGIAGASNSLGDNYIVKADYSTALEYYNKALKINRALNNEKGAALNLRNIGSINATKGNYATALSCFREALKIDEALEDKMSIARDLGNIGSIYQNQSNYAVALEYLLRALKLNEELHDKAGKAGILNSIGSVYISQGIFDQALDNYHKALDIVTELHDKNGIARNMKCVGNVYFSIRKYPEALECYNRAMEIHQELGDKSGIARNMGNMGNVYQEQGDYSRALMYLLRALKMNEELGEKYPMANNLGSIGCMYLTIARDTTGSIRSDSLIPSGASSNAVDKKAALNLALNYLIRAVNIDREIGNLNELQNFCMYLSQAYELSGKFKEALESYNEHILYKDSVFSVENNIKIAKLGEQREDELKQKMIEMQQLKIVAAKHRKFFYIIGLAILVVLSIGLLLRFRTARKTKYILEEKNRIIEGEKEVADILRSRAEKSEAFKRQFLTNMSHEIRTPMNAVNGMTDLLLDKNPRPEQLHYLEVISKSSDILLRLINDILDLSKIEAGKLEIESIDFSLYETINQVKETLAVSAAERGLSLIIAVDNNIPDAVTGDPYRLRQVLTNLGSNAIKFTEDGMVEITAVLQQLNSDVATILFEVTDTGIGIPAEKLKSLFDSFTQEQNADTGIYGGTGLGLAISKHLVELQGGHIQVRSMPGQGSVFSFELKLPRGDVGNLQAGTKEKHTTDGSALKGLRVLLVDDNEYNRMVASETLLSKSDVVIDEATNGQEAINMLEQQDYDVILMDIQMPVMNGLDATRYIRSKLPAPKNATPIIALTASMLPGDMDLCDEVGMNGHLPKPFKTWQLISTLIGVTGRGNS